MKNRQNIYTYRELKKDIEELSEKHPGFKAESIGKSVWKNELFLIRLGHGKTKIMYSGAHHGMEWITSAMLMKFIKDYLEAESAGKSLHGFNVRALSERASLFIVPMVNPDGVELSTKGIPKTLEVMERQRLLRINGSDDFSRWQANAKGVDLNHNYDAMWEKSKAMEREYGIYIPGPTRFSGTHAESEPESHALANLTRKQKFELTIAFHSQGKVIYHGFLGKEPGNSLKIAKAFTKISPYKLDETEGIASYGGYKDWFVDKFERPGYTVEVGEGQNPLPLAHLPQIYKESLPIMLGAMTAV